MAHSFSKRNITNPPNQNSRNVEHSDWYIVQCECVPILVFKSQPQHTTVAFADALLALMSGSSDLDRSVVSLFLAYFKSSCAKVRNSILRAVIN